MKNTETVKPKKKMGDYGYKMYSLPEKVMSVAKVVSVRDHLSYGELITDALELYLAKYPESRLKTDRNKLDRMLRSVSPDINSSPVELDI